MTDIVDRLRKHVGDRGGTSISNGAWTMMLEAASEIERLRYALAAEREACAKVAEARAEICKDALYQGDKMEVHTLNEALHIAAVIRARK